MSIWCDWWIEHTIRPTINSGSSIINNNADWDSLAEYRQHGMKCPPGHMVLIHHPMDRNRIELEQISMNSNIQNKCTMIIIRISSDNDNDYNNLCKWRTKKKLQSEQNWYRIYRAMNCLYTFTIGWVLYVSIQNVILTRTGVGLILKSCGHDLFFFFLRKESILIFLLLVCKSHHWILLETGVVLAFAGYRICQFPLPTSSGWKTVLCTPSPPGPSLSWQRNRVRILSRKNWPSWMTHGDHTVQANSTHTHTHLQIWNIASPT